MNLIEQLGGYGKVNKAVKKMDIRSDRYKRLKAALLNYRRQHNIFEVLDLIMYENKLYEIKYIYQPEKARITDGLQGRTVYDFPRGIRHATSEEIAAGHRL